MRPSLYLAGWQTRFDSGTDSTVSINFNGCSGVRLRVNLPSCLALQSRLRLHIRTIGLQRHINRRRSITIHPSLPLALRQLIKVGSWQRPDLPRHRL